MCPNPNDSAPNHELFLYMSLWQAFLVKKINLPKPCLVGGIGWLSKILAPTFGPVKCLGICFSDIN